MGLTGRVAVVWLGAVTLSGCKTLDVFENNAPQVESVNGLPYLNLLGTAIPNITAQIDPAVAESLRLVPGEMLTLDVIATDPEGRPLRIWFPRAPGGWDFDPDGHVGTWPVPDEIPPEIYQEQGILGVVEDPVRRDPRQREFFVPLWTDGAVDTGYPAP